MRVAQVIRLHPERVEEDERLHAGVPHEVLAQIARSGIRDYSIHRYGELPFARFDYVGEDFESDMAAMAADEATQRWWAGGGPMQQPVEERQDGEMVVHHPRGLPRRLSRRRAGGGTVFAADAGSFGVTTCARSSLDRASDYGSEGGSSSLSRVEGSRDLRRRVRRVTRFGAGLFGTTDS
jgi:L-rhamnose mutarotase